MCLVNNKLKVLFKHSLTDYKELLTIHLNKININHNWKYKTKVETIVKVLFLTFNKVQMKMVNIYRH